MKKKVGRVSDMADKRKNRDFEGNGKRKSQMVKSEKTWGARKVREVVREGDWKTVRETRGNLGTRKV